MEFHQPKNPSPQNQYMKKHQWWNSFNPKIHHVKINICTICTSKSITSKSIYEYPPMIEFHHLKIYIPQNQYMKNHQWWNFINPKIEHLKINIWKSTNDGIPSTPKSITSKSIFFLDYWIFLCYDWIPKKKQLKNGTLP